MKIGDKIKFFVWGKEYFGTILWLKDSSAVRLMGSRDVHERLAEGLRVLDPSEHRDWAIANAEVIRPRQFSTRPYVGVQNYIPEDIVQLQGRPYYARILERGVPFVTKLHNPNRVALMIPSPTGWREESAVFCSTPRQWTFLEGRYAALRTLYPRGFVVQFNLPDCVVPQPRQD